MVDVDILAGGNEIGGTFIRIEDKGRVLIFDQGFRFTAFRNYFGTLMQPRGLDELRSIGVIPDPKWYDGAGSLREWEGNSTR